MTRGGSTLLDGDLVGRIREIVDALVDERRRLRDAPDRSVELEANRLAIVYWQQELTRLNAERSSTSTAPKGQGTRRRAGLQSEG